MMQMRSENPSPFALSDEEWAAILKPTTSTNLTVSTIRPRALKRRLDQQQDNNADYFERFMSALPKIKTKKLK
jgi:hypothetical protein